MLQDTIKYLQQDFDDIIKFGEVGFALEKLSIIDELLQENPEVAASPQDRNILEAMSRKLELVCLPNLDDDRCLEVLKNNLFLAFTMPGYDLEDKLAQKIIFKQYEELEIEFAQKILKVFKESNTRIGSENLIVNGKVLEPSLKNWLLDYENFPTKSGLRTNLEEVEYVSKSRSSNLLNKQERAFLLHFLMLRDLLFNLIQKYNSLPETNDEKQAFKDFNLYNWLPGLGDSEYDNEIKLSSPIKSRDTIAGIGVAPISGANNYISAQKSTLSNGISQPPQNTSPSRISDPAISSVTPKSILSNTRSVLESDNQDIVNLGPGLRMGGGATQVPSSKLKVESGEQAGKEGQMPNAKLPISNAGLRGGSDLGNQSNYAKASSDKMKPSQRLGGLADSKLEFEPGLLSNNSVSENNKTAQLRAVPGSLPDNLRPGLTLNKSISEAKNLSSYRSSGGGPGGSRTPETLASTQASFPVRAHSDELYHKQGNNQKYPQINEVLLPPPSKLRIKQADIDRKLEELDKRLSKNK